MHWVSETFPTHWGNGAFPMRTIELQMVMPDKFNVTHTHRAITLQLWRRVGSTEPSAKLLLVIQVPLSPNFLLYTRHRPTASFLLWPLLHSLSFLGAAPIAIAAFPQENDQPLRALH